MVSSTLLAFRKRRAGICIVVLKIKTASNYSFFKIQFFRYNKAFIYPERGGFGEILPSMMIFIERKGGYIREIIYMQASSKNMMSNNKEKLKRAKMVRAGNRGQVFQQRR